ncbi:MAG: GspE/PulE family protein, partial [Limisphaerales bacterium]
LVASEERPVQSHLAKRLLEIISAQTSSPGKEGHMANRPDLVTALIGDAIAARASDIHLEPQPNGLRVRFRIDGSIFDAAALTMEDGKCLLNQFKALAELDPVTRFTPRDSHARFGDAASAVDLRLAFVPSRQGETLSVRILDPQRLERSIDDLGLTDEKLERLEDWLDNMHGMFLAAGPTGSGKTTTLYALLHELKFADRRVVSVEDPVEYEIPGITQVQLDEKHHLTFAEGVKAVLRLDPDFIMLGEIRDAASAHAAVDAAITGRVLLSTVHSVDAVGAITALRNWGLPDHEIAESVAVVVAQRLVRKLCERCRTPGVPNSSEIEWMEAFGLARPKQVWTAKGCEHCGDLGFYGRTGVFELWRLNEAGYKLILEHADEHALRNHFHRVQRETLLLDGLSKVASGVTTLAELRKTSSGVFPSPSTQNGARKAHRRRPPSGRLGK